MRSQLTDDQESAKQTADKTDYAAIELDYNEPILHVAYMLPYRLEKSLTKPNEFIAH